MKFFIFHFSFLFKSSILRSFPIWKEMVHIWQWKWTNLRKKCPPYNLEFGVLYHFWNFTNLHQILNIDETLQVMKSIFKKLKIQMIVPLVNFQINMIIFWSNLQPFRWLLRLWMHLPMLFYIIFFFLKEHLKNSWSIFKIWIYKVL